MPEIIQLSDVAVIFFIMFVDSRGINDSKRCWLNGQKKFKIEIDSSIWREEIQNIDSSIWREEDSSIWRDIIHPS
jgi:hypothetical protein